MKDVETDKDNSRLPRVRGGGPRAFVSSNTDKPNCGIIFRVRGDVLEQRKVCSHVDRVATCLESETTGKSFLTLMIFAAFSDGKRRRAGGC